MQGLTNAAPPSGGLRIVASGVLDTIGTQQTFQLPEPAKLVIGELQWGDSTTLCVASIPNSLAVNFFGAGYQGSQAAYLGLLEDGMTIKYYMSNAVMPGSKISFTAFA